LNAKKPKKDNANPQKPRYSSSNAGIVVAIPKNPKISKNPKTK
jgi:hypothetical protein